MARRQLDRPRVRLEGLDQHASRGIAAAPPGELSQELERPFVGPEVGNAERGVGVDHGRERDAAEVMPLRDHLRAEQHGALGLGEAPQRGGERLRLLCRVGVETNRHELRQLLRQLPLEPLRARTDSGELDRRAGGTGLGRCLGVAAVVAAETPFAVKDERHVAERAPERRAAGAAMERGRNAAAVQQQDRLAAVLLDRAELPEERSRERIAGLAAQIDHPHAGQRTTPATAELEALEPLPALRPRSRAAVDRDGAF